jgi:hypothetical protein
MNIKGKQKLPLILAVSFALLAALHCARADGEMSAAAVLDLLPTGPDMHDLREKANLEKLIDQGEAAFPGLLDIIRTDNSPYVAGRALGVLRYSQNASPAARREVVTELGKVLYDRKSLTGYRDERTLSLMAQAIADMGEAGDAMLLLPLLDHPSGDVRSAGYSGMEKLAAKAVPQGSPVDGKPLAQDIGNVATEREPVPQAKKTYQDYPEWELFPKGFDSEDENAIAAREWLENRGEAAHEALMAIVRECDDPYVVGSALSILRSSQGEKTEIVSQLKEFLATRLPGESRDDEIVIVDTASALADMGKDGDLEVLIPMLSNPSWQIRSVGIMLLGNYGGQKELKALKEARGSTSGGLALKGMDEAVSGIESRLAEQDAESSPSP